MAITQTSDYYQARAALLSSRALTTEERAALSVELANDPAERGYKDGQGVFKPAAELFALLNDPYQAPNPEPNPGRYITADSVGLLSHLSQESVARVLNWGNLPLIRADIRERNRAALIEWASIALPAAGIITVEEAGALMAYLSTTEDEPSWPATVQVVGRAQQVAGVVVELGESAALVAELGA